MHVLTRMPAVSPRRRHRLCVTVKRARRMDGGGANIEAAAGCAGRAECKWKLRYDEAMVRIDSPCNYEVCPHEKACASVPCTHVCVPRVRGADSD